MPETVLNFLFVYVPVALVALGLLVWARQTSMFWLKVLLNAHVFIWTTLLLIVDGALIWAIENCSGNALYGFSNCTRISGSTANYALPIFFFANLFAAAITVLIIIVGLIAQWHAHKTR